MSIGAPVNERLAKITEAGVSVWLDQIRRTLITGGELQQLVEEYSLRGMTSNPAIFEKAILGSDDYDEDLRELTAEGLDARQIFERIAIKDVQLAADVLRVVWDEADGADGFVSLEVSPSLAHDTEGTLAEARSFWERVDRPNTMIKIPGTEEGLPAIEQAIYEGINVNVTLLFKVESYVEVTERYIRGLERRLDEGKSVDIHSVASFFVSRVDTEVDRRLEEIGRTDLQGRAGIANARAAYKRFKEIFLGERFARVRDAGAPVQRPLWASTGVKNPRYADTMYVDELVAPHTVNTMPMATLHAVADHSQYSGGASADRDPSEDLNALAEAGIDMSDVTDTLLREGIEKFVEPFDELIRGVESAREAAVTHRPPTISSSIPDELQPLIVEHIQRSQKEDVVRRIWRKDVTLWAPEGTPEIANRLGWLTITDAMLEQVPDLTAFAEECRAAGLRYAVLLGMGGSSLGPEVLRRSFPEAPGLTLHVLDSTDPGAILAVEQAIDLDKTMFVVSSKSGGTIETLSQMRYFYERCGGDGSHFCAVTDPGSSLVDEAKSRGFRRVFEADPNIGGRYSVLSHFGMVPAALAGIDIEGLLRGAQVAEQNCQSPAPQSNSGLWMGVAVGALAMQAHDKATFAVDEPVASFGLWVEQLIAESTGKQGKGVLPVAGEPVGDPGEYGDDRVFVHLRNEEEPDEALAQGVEALGRAGQPVVKLTHKGAEDLGRVFFFAEFAVAVAGWVLGINPFDQPNVQEAKDNTNRVLAGGDLPEVEPGDLSELLEGAAPPNYLAIMGYVQPSDEFDAAVAAMRVELRGRTECTTTFGYGPRFLHSTGQFHKGGPPTGRFIQLIHDGVDDVEIPEAGYTFRHLKNAQAVGDLQTLRDHGLPAVQVRLEGDPAEAIRRLI